MSEAHLDAFALVTRPEKCLRAHQPARHIASILMNVAWYFPCELPGAATRLEGTDIAIQLGSAIEKRPAIVHSTTGVQHLVVGADVDATLLLPFEVGAG